HRPSTRTRGKSVWALITGSPRLLQGRGEVIPYGRPMRRTDVLVIGAGQAGLAVSRCLTDANLEHVVLERGRLAERWRSERWDSLRLLSPNWATRLPGWSYRGPRPDGYMSATEFAGYLSSY